MRVPTRLRTLARACASAVAAAHNGPRRIDAPAERVPPAVARRRAEKPARTETMFDTDAVFHAPMSALNADAEWNACEPSNTRSTTDGKACARVGVDAWAPNRTRTRARTDAARGRVCAAGPHR